MAASSNSTVQEFLGRLKEDLEDSLEEEAQPGPAVLEAKKSMYAEILSSELLGQLECEREHFDFGNFKKWLTSRASISAPRGFLCWRHSVLGFLGVRGGPFQCCGALRGLASGPRGRVPSSGKAPSPRGRPRASSRARWETAANYSPVSSPLTSSSFHPPPPPGTRSHPCHRAHAPVAAGRARDTAVLLARRP